MNKKILIIYERKNREFECCCLLKIYLEKDGFKCDIAQFYDFRYFNVLGKSKYQFIFVPHLYNTQEIGRTLGRFGNNAIIINLQYEQVLSEKWEKLGHHTPSGKATESHHICWGPATRDRLIGAGVNPSVVHTLGALQMDLLRKEFRLGKELKNSLTEKFELSQNRQWVLFLSSFTYADIEPSRLKMNEKVAGAELSSFVGIHTASRNEILNWLDRIVEKFPEREFIYRPHPDELALDKVYKLERKHKNFNVINYGSAKLWIEAADHIWSWYSTTVVEAHFLEKSYSILRPIELPDDFDSVLLKKGKFITTFDKLYTASIESASIGSYALDVNDVNEYYTSDKIPVFEKIRCLLNDLSNGNSAITSGFVSLLPHRVKSIVLSVFIPIILSENKVIKRVVNKYSFLTSWRAEFKNQFNSENDHIMVLNNIKRRMAER